MRKVLIFVTILTMILSLAACGETVTGIAGSVAEAAKAELEAQVKAALEEHKVKVVQMKTAIGKLNDDGSDVQFYCAALVQSDSAAVPEACAKALDVLFQDAGVFSQSSSRVDSDYLVHKDITFSHSDFSAGNYYVIYAYMGDLSLDLPAAKGE